MVRPFGAAAEAADPSRPLWLTERDDPSDPVPCRTTQRRRTGAAIAMLGLAPELDTATADRVASVLDVPTGDHRAARETALGAITIRQQAAAVASILEALVLDDRLFARLIGSGLLAGVWRQAGVWNERRGRIEFPVTGRWSSPVRSAPTRAPPNSLSRGRSGRP